MTWTLTSLRLAGLAMAFAAMTSAADATIITFTPEPIGAKANGFSPVESGDISFTDTSGANLQVADFAHQSFGNALAVFGDDASKLQINFAYATKNVGLSFGNDDSVVAVAGDLAILQGYLGGILVGTVTVALNVNDLMDQSISLGGLMVDEAVFYYGNAAQTPIALIEIVDNISFDAVPAPAALPLVLSGLGFMGLLGWRRRRRNGAAAR